MLRDRVMVTQVRGPWGWAEACFRKKDLLPWDEAWPHSTRTRLDSISPPARGQPSFVPEEMSEPNLLEHFFFSQFVELCSLKLVLRISEQFCVNHRT